MSRDTILVLLTNVGTLVTAAAALLTVLEMRRQRRALYKPEFVCKAPPFKILRANDDLIPFRILPPVTDGEQSYSRSRLFLDCENIGLGPAKSVTHTWTFDARSMVETLANRGVNVSDVLIESGLLKIGGVTSSESDVLTFVGSAPVVMHSLLGQKSGLQPVVRTGKSISIPIPSAYLDLFALYLVTQSAKELRVIASFRALSLELSYQDIESKSHLSRFTLTPSFIMMSFRPVGDGPNELDDAEGFFQVQEG